MNRRNPIFAVTERPGWPSNHNRPRISHMWRAATAMVTLLMAFVVTDPLHVSATTNSLYVSAMFGVDSPTCGFQALGYRPCRTIGQALRNAGSGAVIYVLRGQYNETLTVTATVTLIGAGSASTIIDGGRAGTVVTVLPNETVTIR